MFPVALKKAIRIRLQNTENALSRLYIARKSDRRALEYRPILKYFKLISKYKPKVFVAACSLEHF